MEGFNTDTLKYGDVLNTVLSKELWDFLNEPEIIIRMETASYLGRPALEAIQLQILERFNEEEITSRYKQLMGIMAKQVLVKIGYEIAKTGVKIRAEGGLFKTASSYKKK